MTATHSIFSHRRPTNRVLIAGVLIGLVGLLAAVGCEGAATAADDIGSVGAPETAAVGSAATDRENSEVVSEQPAGLREATVGVGSIDSAMLQPERQSEFPELAPFSPAEFSAVLREATVGVGSIDLAMLQPERQSEFPELAPLSPAELIALLP